jgi:vancomycin resistance protein VanW
LQRGKERNVALASRRIDGIAIWPGQVFSYHHAVGRPSLLRGFRPGLELHEGRLSAGIGGGCCAVSNLLYLLALRAGLTIVERHRHALDLFPDHGRTVPFGCGATVFYNQADLRFANPLPFPVLLCLEVMARTLRGRIAGPSDPGFTVEIYEVGHRRFREGDGPAAAWWRENHVRRRLRRPDGTVIADEEVAHNRAKLAYDPEAPCGAR